MSQHLASANTSLAADIPGLEKFSRQEIVMDAGSGRYVEVPKGGSAIFKISLLVVPDADLVINLRQRSGAVNLNMTPASLTFTKADWKSPQIVMVNSASAISSAASYATLEVVGQDSMPIREVFLHLH